MRIDKEKSKQIFLQNQEKLSDNQRILLNFYLVKDRTQKDVALHFNYTLSVTRNQLSRALYHLREVSNLPEHRRAKEILYGQ